MTSLADSECARVRRTMLAARLPRRASSHLTSLLGGLRLPWNGHRLHGDVVLRAGEMSLADADRMAAEAEASVKQHVRNVDEMVVRVMSA